MNLEVVGSSVRKLIMFDGHICHLLCLSADNLDHHYDRDDEDFCLSSDSLDHK